MIARTLLFFLNVIFEFCLFYVLVIYSVVNYSDISCIRLFTHTIFSIKTSDVIINKERFVTFYELFNNFSVIVQIIAKICVKQLCLLYVRFTVICV